MIQMRTRYEWMTEKQRKAYADLMAYWCMMSNAKTELGVKCGYNGANRVLNEYFPVDAVMWNGLDKHFHNCMKRFKMMNASSADSTTVTVTVCDDVTVTITKRS